MTPPQMIAMMVTLTSFIVALVITCIFCLLDTLEKKECHHFCKICKHKDICDYYQNKKHPLQ